MFLGVWLWVAFAPLAFLDPEYPAWLAKERLLAACDLGDTLILGDSRAAVDLMPALLPGRVTNLAVGGGEPIEAYFALRRALSCPRPPRRVILSFDAIHFVRPDLFWERSVAFGFLRPADVRAMLAVSRRLRDPSVARVRLPSWEPARLRAALYAARFPTLYFAALAHAGGIMRLWENRQRLAQVLAARGQYFFGTADGSATVAEDAHLRRFRPLPVLDWYFRALIACARARGIAVDFVAMPMNDATFRTIDPRVRNKFADYLAKAANRIRGFRIVGNVMPHWPDRYFGDGFSHLNPEGARRFSRGFARWLEAARRTQRPWKTGGRFSMKDAVASR
ncbi:MAG: hypothetical protein KGI51_00700 [Rhodospirillales bacterium]|nr:hypothetical protein [Rhodospirillales bacterium]